MGVSGREWRGAKEGEQFRWKSPSRKWCWRLKYFVGIVRDITERKQAEQKIAHLAHYDYLTDLPNRALFLSTLEHSIRLARRNDYKVSVLFLDLDGFKQVNDTLDTMREICCCGSFQTPASHHPRIGHRGAVGGDEFTFVLNNTDRTKALRW